MKPLARLATLPRPVLYTAAGVVALGLVAAGIVLFLRAHTLAVSRASVSELVRKADNEISGGFYSAALPYLERAMKSANTRDSWLSIAKRAYAIGKATKDYRFLLQVATRGTNSLPGSQELWALRVLSQARGGEPVEAQATARSHLTGARYQSFATEAILRAHPNLHISGQSVSKEDQRIIDTLTSRDPALFENLAKEINSSDLLFDAVLLYAWKGQMKDAYTLLLSLGAAANPEAGMLISYDAGQYDSVQSYYEGVPEADRSPSFQLLADDVLVENKEYDKAAIAYEQMIQAHPDASWMPYADLAWLAAAGKSARVSVAHALKLLREGQKRFPDQREVVLSLASLEQSTGNLQSAGSLLTEYLKSHPWDLDANLLSMRITGASENPERLRSRLWELFYRASGSDRDRIARFLGWYLLGINDYEGLRLIFAQMKTRTDAEWLPLYHGIYDALLGDYASSMEQLNMAYSITPRWQTLYDMGVVELKQGDPKSASDNLQKADSMLTGDGETRMKSPQRAVIHVALAEALEKMGNTEAAKREVLYALDMDPSNLSAALLRKKLDSTLQK